MKKFFKYTSVIFLLFFLMILFLINGFTTTYFNEIIQKKFYEKFPLVNINFDSVTTTLRITNLNLNLKLKNPNLFYKNKKINLKKIEISANLISFIKKENKLKQASFDLEPAKIKDLIILKDLLNIKALSKFSNKFKDGEIEGNFLINFDNLKKIESSGKIKNISFELNKGIPNFENLNANFNYKNSSLRIENVSANFLDLKVRNSSAEFQLFNPKVKKFESTILLSGKIDKLFLLKDITNFKLPNELKNINGNIDINIKLKANLDNNFDFKEINSNSQIKISNGNADYLFVSKNKKKKKIFKLNNINFTSKLMNELFTIKGSLLLENYPFNFTFEKKINSNNFRSQINGNFDTSLFQEIINNKIINGPVGLKLNYKRKDLKNFIEADLDISKSLFLIKNLAYRKFPGTAAKIKVKIEPKKNFYLLNSFNYISGKDNISFSNLKLNKDFYLLDLERGSFSTKKNNFVIINKKDEFLIDGKSINLTNYIKSITSKKKKRSLFSQKFKAKFNINFSKVFIANDTLNNVIMTSSLNNRKIVSLNGFGAFSKKETAQIEIKRNNKNQLETKIISDRSKPFLIGLKFTKDFTNGKLNFLSEKINENQSYNKVILTNFYVKKMPILANLLSLTSFSGILDTLEGKGVFFDKSYLEYEIKNKKLSIIEAYGTGDSLGYILKGNINADGFVSLSGNLVPAYMLNNLIRQIPLIGKVLTGKKGDGIFGASFKIKGKANSLKTRVNPIRTLTPRFIQRFLELFKS